MEWAAYGSLVAERQAIEANVGRWMAESAVARRSTPTIEEAAEDEGEEEVREAAPAPFELILPLARPAERPIQPALQRTNRRAERSTTQAALQRSTPITSVPLGH